MRFGLMKKRTHLIYVGDRASDGLFEFVEEGPRRDFDFTSRFHILCDSFEFVAGTPTIRDLTGFAKEFVCVRWKWLLCDIWQELCGVRKTPKHSWAPRAVR